MKNLCLASLLIISAVSFASEQPAKGSGSEMARLQAIAPSLMALPTDPPTPEQIRESMNRAIEMHNEQTKARLKAFSEPEMVESFAQFSRSYYEALIRAGFTKEEALNIVISVGIPSFR
ncbi:MAG: hypothetical protein WC247_14345 [Porticoccaceae bacterium]|jgi:hypothetical protein